MTVSAWNHRPKPGNNYFTAQEYNVYITAVIIKVSLLFRVCVQSVCRIATRTVDHQTAYTYNVF